MDIEQDLQDRISLQADSELRTTREAAQTGVDPAKRSVARASEALEWDELAQALHAPAPPLRASAEWRESEALFQEVVDRMVEKGEVSVSRIQVARQAVSLDLHQEAQWSGEIESLPWVVETVMRVVTRTEAAIGELEDHPGRLREAAEGLIEEHALQHAIALGLLHAHAERAPLEVRQELERALLEQRAQNWVERERIKVTQRENLSHHLSTPVIGAYQMEESAYLYASKAIERSAGADSELRARALEVAQDGMDRARQSIEQEMEELEFDELELED